MIDLLYAIQHNSVVLTQKLKYTDKDPNTALERLEKTAREVVATQTLAQ